MIGYDSLVLNPNLGCADELNLYILMEPMLGGNLRTHLRMQPEQKFRNPTAKLYAAQVVLALFYLHTR